MTKTWRRWTAGDDNFLKDNYFKMTTGEIGEKLNRTTSSVQQRGNFLGLRRQNKNASLKERHNEIVELIQAEHSIPEIANIIQESYGAVHHYLKHKKIAVVSGRVDGNKDALLDGFEEEALDPVNFNKITFAEWYKRWYNAYRKGDIRESTKIKYRGTYMRIREHPFGDKRLVKITREDVQAYVNWYGADRSKNTVLDHMQTIRSCLKDALIDGHIKQNPAMNVKPIFKEQQLTVVEQKELREVKKWLEVDEYQKLRYYLVFGLQKTLEQDPDLFRGSSLQSAVQIRDVVIFIALKTGARLSEILALTKDDVLEGTSELSIDKTWDYKKLECGGFLQTKNTASIRKVLVDKETINIIKKYMDWLKTHEITTQLDTLFNLEGHNQHVYTINKHLKRTLNKLDIYPITMHKLRHTHASYLIAKGVPLQVIAKRLGHTDTNMIRRVYGHLLQETEQMGNKMILELI